MFGLRIYRLAVVGVFAATLVVAQATSTLRGVVVREGTDEPLRDAEISVNDYNPQNLTMLESFRSR